MARVYGRGFDAPIQFDADGLATVHDSSFLTDPLFVRAYSFGCEIATSAGKDLHIEWRAWVVLWATRQALLCKGDFVECGVYTGILSGTICDYLGFETIDRNFWLLDTFDGLPDEQISADERKLGIHNYNSEYRKSDLFEKVRNKFRRYPNVHVVRGMVPDSLSQIRCESIAYLSLDMNMVYPELCAISELWDRISPGGIIVLDDYTQRLHVHQKVSFDAFAQEKGIPILGLPTGQGLMIKPASPVP